MLYMAVFLFSVAGSFMLCYITLEKKVKFFPEP